MPRRSMPRAFAPNVERPTNEARRKSGRPRPGAGPAAREEEEDEERAGQTHDQHGPQARVAPGESQVLLDERSEGAGEAESRGALRPQRTPVTGASWPRSIDWTSAAASGHGPDDRSAGERPVGDRRNGPRRGRHGSPRALPTRRERSRRRRRPRMRGGPSPCLRGRPSGGAAGRGSGGDRAPRPTKRKRSCRRRCRDRPWRRRPATWAAARIRTNVRNTPSEGGEERNGAAARQAAAAAASRSGSCASTAGCARLATRDDRARTDSGIGKCMSRETSAASTSATPARRGESRPEEADPRGRGRDHGEHELGRARPRAPEGRRRRPGSRGPRRSGPRGRQDETEGPLPGPEEPPEVHAPATGDEGDQPIHVRSCLWSRRRRRASGRRPRGSRHARGRAARGSRRGSPGPRSGPGR